MLGNFSFGDYFKEDVICFVWEFFIGVMKFLKEKLWIIVYQDDQEVEKIWLEMMGVDFECFLCLGVDSNFWQMGDMGFCGFCIEIFYDYGVDVWGGLLGSLEEDGDCYIEIWNLVFM